MNKKDKTLKNKYSTPEEFNHNYKQYRAAIDKLYLKSIRELELYAYYILRCLYRCNIHIQPSDLTLITQERNNGSIAQAVVYPRESVVDGKGIVNPMFCYGFKWDYTENYDIKVTFTEDYKELGK